MPKLNTSADGARSYATDIIMPHFGKVFGLSEDAAALVLSKMELVKIDKTKRTTINANGIESFKALFKCNKAFESSPTHLSENGSEVHFFRIGKLPEDLRSPRRLWGQYKNKKKLLKKKKRSDEAAATRSKMARKLTPRKHHPRHLLLQRALGCAQLSLLRY